MLGLGHASRGKGVADQLEGEQVASAGVESRVEAVESPAAILGTRVGARAAPKKKVSGGPTATAAPSVADVFSSIVSRGGGRGGGHGGDHGGGRGSKVGNSGSDSDSEDDMEESSPLIRPTKPRALPPAIPTAIPEGRGQVMHRDAWGPAAGTSHKLQQRQQQQQQQQQGDGGFASDGDYSDAGETTVAPNPPPDADTCCHSQPRENGSMAQRAAPRRWPGAVTGAFLWEDK